MSYTNLEIVRKHINLDEIQGGLRSDVLITFADLDWINLPGRGIVENSVIIKAIKNYAPYSEEITLGDGVVSLSNDRLVTNSMTIAADSSLGIIYSENIDFSVDCTNGTVRRLSDGSIVSGSMVTVWYYYYSVYAEGIDYSVNSQSGMVRRLPGGDIQANQTIYLDYELSLNQLNDEFISEAVREANAIIEKQIDPNRQFGADLTLQMAATCLAMSLVCRMAAISDLRFGSSTKQTTSAWFNLAESYRDDYHNLLKVFRPQSTGLSGPTHT
jgi:hypothetical protein